MPLSPACLPSHSRQQRYFILALFSAKGERVRPDMYKNLPVQYRIAALEEKKASSGRAGTVTHEVGYRCMR